MQVLTLYEGLFFRELTITLVYLPAMTHATAVNAKIDVLFDKPDECNNI